VPLLGLGLAGFRSRQPRATGFRQPASRWPLFFKNPGAKGPPGLNSINVRPKLWREQLAGQTRARVRRALNELATQAWPGMAHQAASLPAMAQASKPLHSSTGPVWTVLRSSRPRWLPDGLRFLRTGKALQRSLQVHEMHRQVPGIREGDAATGPPPKGGGGPHPVVWWGVFFHEGAWRPGEEPFQTPKQCFEAIKCLCSDWAGPSRQITGEQVAWRPDFRNCRRLPTRAWVRNRGVPWGAWLHCPVKALPEGADHGHGPTDGGAKNFLIDCGPIG